MKVRRTHTASMGLIRAGGWADIAAENLRAASAWASGMECMKPIKALLA
jgi:hypothetical protein